MSVSSGSLVTVLKPGTTRTLGKYFYITNSYWCSISVQNMNVEVVFHQKFSDFQRKVTTLCPFVPLVRAACRWKWVWSIGGMMLIAKIRSMWRQSCLSASLSTKDFTRIDLGSNPGLLGERPAKSSCANIIPYSITRHHLRRYFCFHVKNFAFPHFYKASWLLYVLSRLLIKK